MTSYARAAGGGGNGGEAIYHGRTKPLTVETLEKMSKNMNMKILVCDFNLCGIADMSFLDFAKNLSRISIGKPEFLTPMVGRGLVVAMGFGQEDVYKGWLQNGFTINEILVRLIDLSAYSDAKKLANDKYAFQTVTILGCPHASIEDVKRWIQPYNATLAPNCTQLKRTQQHGFWNGGLRFVVRLERKKLLPGKLKVNIGDELYVIDIEYKLLDGTVWCNKCLGEGHIAAKCSAGNEQQEPMDGGEEFLSADGSDAETPKTVAEAPRSMTYIDREADAEKREELYGLLPNEFHEGVLRCNQYPKVAHFGREVNSELKVLSNQYMAPVIVEGETFASNEHYVCVQLCRAFPTFQHLEEKVRAAKSGAEAHSICKEIKHCNDIDERQRCSIIYKSLCIVNFEKYKQNQNLLKILLSTKSNNCRLAETIGPKGSKFWSTGMGLADKNCNDPTKWAGKNVFGDLLTYIRDDLFKQIESLKRKKGDEDGSPSTEGAVGRKNTRSKSVAEVEESLGRGASK